jgi:hypothetical protein
VVADGHGSQHVSPLQRKGSDCVGIDARKQEWSLYHPFNTFWSVQGVMHPDHLTTSCIPPIMCDCDMQSSCKCLAQCLDTCDCVQDLV